MVLVSGMVLAQYALADRMAEAHALVGLVEQGWADQLEVARAFDCSARTVRRHQRRFEEGGLAALSRADGYPRGRPRLAVSRRSWINRLVVRVRDTDINRSRETWWTYELSSGKRLGKFDLTASDGGTAAPISALPVTATPLILVHYWRYDAPNMNARFALLDPQFKEVWSTTWRRDYNVNGDEAAEDRLREQIWGHGAILNTSNSNRFDLFSARTSERVSFSVRRAATGSKQWVVVEEARTKHQIAGTEAQQPLRFQTESLKLLGKFALQEDRTAGYEVLRNVIGFCFDERGRIGLLRRGNDKHHSFALVDSEGTLIRETSVPARRGRFSDSARRYPAPTGIFPFQPQLPASTSVKFR